MTSGSHSITKVFQFTLNPLHPIVIFLYLCCIGCCFHLPYYVTQREVLWFACTVGLELELNGYKCSFSFSYSTTLIIHYSSTSVYSCQPCFMHGCAHARPVDKKHMLCVPLQGFLLQNLSAAVRFCVLVRLTVGRVAAEPAVEVDENSAAGWTGFLLVKRQRAVRFSPVILPLCPPCAFTGFLSVEH